MSEENVEIVLGMLGAWASGDRNAARAAFDEQIIFLSPAIDASVAHGVDAMERAMERWRQTWKDFRIESELVRAARDQVVVVSRQSGVGAGSGALVELETFGVYTLRNSRIIRVEFFETQAEALEAAGLPE